MDLSVFRKSDKGSRDLQATCFFEQTHLTHNGRDRLFEIFPTAILGFRAFAMYSWRLFGRKIRMLEVGGCEDTRY